MEDLINSLYISWNIQSACVVIGITERLLVERIDHSPLLFHNLIWQFLLKKFEGIQPM